MGFAYYTEAIVKWRLDEFMNLIDNFENDFVNAVQQQELHVSNDYRIILFHICGKVILTTREILTLCAHGYPDGALSLARNLYEQMMIVAFFERKKGGDAFQDFVDNYLLHYDVQRNKALRAIEKQPTEVAILTAEREALKKQAKKSIGGDYWWSDYSDFAALAESFIEEETDHKFKNFMYKQYATYKRACISLHAGCMGNVIRLGNDLNIGVVDTAPTLYGQSTPLAFATCSLIYIVAILCLTFNIDGASFNSKLNELAKDYQQREHRDVRPTN